MRTNQICHAVDCLARNAVRPLAALAVLLLVFSTGRAEVTLSSYSFAADNLPTIRATATDIADAMTAAGTGGFYRLRAKITGLPYGPGWYQSIDSINNNNARLASVPGTGTFPVELYWVAYSSNGTLVGDNYASRATQILNISNPAAGSMGLREDHYSTKDLFPQAATVATGKIPDYSWGTSGTSYGTGPNNFSVRWTGLIEPQVTGEHVFTLKSDDGMRLYIGDMATPVVTGWSNHGNDVEQEGRMTLDAGRAYAVMIEYYQDAGAAVVQLFWTPPGGSRQVIPVTRFIPSPVGGGANLPPAVITQPQNQSVNAGGTATFSVVVSGSPFPSFQWEKSGSYIAGATGTSLTIANVTPADAGQYRVLVNNGVNYSTASSYATLSINSTAGPGSGNGLAGLYYNGDTFNQFVRAQLDSTVDVAWGDGGRPMEGMGSDLFSVRWVGKVETPVTGNYNFSVYCDDGIRVILDGVTIINSWAPGGRDVGTTSPVYLVAGTKHDIVVEYYENSQDAFIHLYWQLPGAGSREIIPSSRLYAAPLASMPGWQNRVDQSFAFYFTPVLDPETNEPTGDWTSSTVIKQFTTTTGGAVRISTTGNADPVGDLVRYDGSTRVVLRNIDGGGEGQNILTDLWLPAGTYSIELEGRHQTETEDNFNLVVDARADGAPPVTPTITMSGTISIALGSSSPIIPSIAGSPAPTISLVQGALPSGMTLNSQTGVISGTATNPGVYAFSLQATNYGGNYQKDVTLTVTGSSTAAPSFVVQPQSKTASAGTDVTFIAAAVGVPEPAFQWYRNVSGNYIPLLNAQPYSGANTPQLTISGVTSAMSGYQFFCYVNSPAGVTSSSFVTLTVTPPAGPGSFVVTTPAGLGGTAGYVDSATGTSSRFNETAALATDGTYIYICDQLTNRVRKLNIATSAVTTFPTGSGSYTGFGDLSGIAVDAAGRVYVADTAENKIKVFTSSGTLTETIGTGSTGLTNGGYSTATFTSPIGLAVNSGGTVAYVADFGNDRIRRIDLNARSVSTIDPGFRPWGCSLSIDGTVLFVTDYWNGLIKQVAVTAGDTVSTVANGFSTPRGVVQAPDLSLYIADRGSHTIKRIQSGNVTTIAGSSNVSGTSDGPGANARFQGPFGIVATSSDSIYVGDHKNFSIRRLLPDGAPFITSPNTVTFTRDVSGSFMVTATGSPAPTLSIVGSLPPGLAFQSASGQLSGTPSAAGTFNFTVRATSNGVSQDQAFTLIVNSASAPAAFTVVTVAGAGGVPGYVDNNQGTLARFNETAALATDGTYVYVCDQTNHRIRKVRISDGQVSTLFTPSGSSSGSTGINDPGGIGVASNGFVFVADTGDNQIKVFNSTGVLQQTIGTGAGAYQDGSISAAKFLSPIGLAVSSDGMSVYVADYNNEKIRKIDRSAGQVSTLVSSLRAWACTLSPDGAILYVTDYTNGAAKKIALTSGNTITTIATGFSAPRGITLDTLGNVYVANTGTHAIRRITPLGVVTTVAGNNGVSGIADGPGSGALFQYPFGIVATSPTSIFVGDHKNHTIRQLIPDNSPTTILTQPASLIVTPSANASFTVAASGSGLTYQWQRQPAGSVTFASLSNNSTYSGANSATLTVTGTTTAMSGDQFQCIVTGTGGSVLSSAATLTVTAGNIDTTNQLQLKVNVPNLP